MKHKKNRRMSCSATSNLILELIPKQQCSSWCKLSKCNHPIVTINSKSSAPLRTHLTIAPTPKELYQHYPLPHFPSIRMAMEGTKVLSTTFQLASNHILEYSCLPIAIIGSSCIGLTFTNILDWQSIPAILFDSRPPPYTYVSGSSKLNIPFYEFITKQLDLEYQC